MSQERLRELRLWRSLAKTGNPFNLDAAVEPTGEKRERRDLPEELLDEG